LGFGISRPQQVSAGIRAGAAGVISGSAVIERLQRLGTGATTPETLAEWLRSMRAATRKVAK